MEGNRGLPGGLGSPGSVSRPQSGQPAPARRVADDANAARRLPAIALTIDGNLRETASVLPLVHSMCRCALHVRHPVDKQGFIFNLSDLGHGPREMLLQLNGGWRRRWRRPAVRQAAARALVDAIARRSEKGKPGDWKPKRRRGLPARSRAGIDLQLHLRNNSAIPSGDRHVTHGQGYQSDAGA